MVGAPIVHSRWGGVQASASVIFSCTRKIQKVASNNGGS